jgi:hypothetical protein
MFIRKTQRLTRRLGLQQHIGGAHNEVGVDRFPLCDLGFDALESIVTALGKDGGA